MILKLFNGKFLLLQIGIIIAFLALMMNHNVSLYPPQGFGPLYGLVFNWLQGHTLAIFITYFALLIIEGLLLQLIVSYYKLVPRDNFIILLVYFLLSFSNPSLTSINPVVIASTLTTWGLFRLLSISELENTLPNLFTAGFLFSTASLVYGNMIWFIVFLIIGLMVLSLFRGRELLISLISFAIPYLFLLTYGFIFDQEFIFWNQFHFNYGEWSFFSNGIQLWLSIATFFITILLSIYAVVNVMLQLFSKLIQIRKSTSLIFTLLIISTLLQFLSGPWWFSHPTLIFIPLSILLSIFFAELKNTFYFNLIILSIIILEIVQLYYTNYAQALS